MLVQIGKHKVVLYDSIEDLPIKRFHKYQQYLMIDAGIGSDIQAFDKRVERVKCFMMEGKTEDALKEFENLRICVYQIQQGISPKHKAFGMLVTEIDGQEYDDADKALEALSDVTDKDLTALLEAVKKKIDSELQLYFPALFNTSDVKEFYDILKRRTLSILEGIVEGKIDEKAVTDLTTKLITYSKPQVFQGSMGAEIMHDRQFEDLCLALSEQLHLRPKELSVLEFYNAFDFLRERSRKQQKNN